VHEREREYKRRIEKLVRYAAEGGATREIV